MPPAREVVLDEGLLDQVSRVIEAARARGVLTGALSASDVLRIPQALEIRTKADAGGAGPSESLAALVDAVLDDAMDALVAMRVTEGRFLEADLDARLATIGAFVDDLERLARAGQEALVDRLRARVAELPADVAGDPTALAQEIVRFVVTFRRGRGDRAACAAHLEHWQALAKGPEPCGRKLDFLLQEMNREINTIGSKAEGARATETVIAAKAELERLREQVQNVE